MPKLRVGVMFGGISTEHEVSVVSATTVFQSLDPSRYTAVLIGVDHDGSFRVAEPDRELMPEAVFSSRRATRAFPSLRATLDFLRERDLGSALDAPLDVVFPMIHGRGGEDGSLQGLLELAGIPYVGAGVLATALCMDKALSKRALRDAGIPVVPCREVDVATLERDPTPFIAEVEGRFGFPMFIKPSNTGSSVGVYKVRTQGELALALKNAGRYDLDVIAEPAVDAREIECGVLGGRPVQVSPFGEIEYESEFYDYEAKYASDATRLLIPARLSTAIADELRSLAARAFEVVKGWGLARVDFFVDRASDAIYLNELNTHPGFTDGSMYPKLWEAAGIALPDLVDRLIELALSRHRARAALETRFRL